MTEKLTGKEALLAILQGTHWWRNKDTEIAWISETLMEQYKLYPASAGNCIGMVQISARELMHSLWTRGEPIEDEE